MIHYCYRTTNLTNGKYYIGKRSTSRYDNWFADPYMGSGKILKAAIKKHGKHIFQKVILCYAESKKENAENEILFVADQWELDDCYNLMPGGQSIGYRHSEKTKQKMSQDRKGKPGKKHSEGTKKKIAETLKGKGKPVLQYSKDGNFIAEYSSLGEAGRQTNLNHSHICKVCKGKYKTTGGFVWKYKVCGKI